MKSQSTNISQVSPAVQDGENVLREELKYPFFDWKPFLHHFYIKFPVFKEVSLQSPMGIP